MLRMTDAEARQLAESCSWTFATTMPSIPHWYIVRDRDLGREEFKALALHIREHGRAGHWGVQPRKTFMEDGTVVDGLIYWEAGGYRYWSMGSPLDDETIINRERVEREGIRWADEEE